MAQQDVIQQTQSQTIYFTIFFYFLFFFAELKMHIFSILCMYKYKFIVMTIVHCEEMLTYSALCTRITRCIIHIKHFIHHFLISTHARLYDCVITIK